MGVCVCAQLPYGTRGMRLLQLWRSRGPGEFGPLQLLQLTVAFSQGTVGREVYSASTVLFAKFKGRRKGEVWKGMGETWVEQ